MAYTIEGLGRTGERSFIGIEPTPDSALDVALDAESRGVDRVTITSSTGWKYSIAEFATVTRRAPSFAKGGPAEFRPTL